MTARDAVLRPPARPDLPILVASKGPRMMELTARHADAWNAAWFGMPDERLARLRRELAEACERVGRDPASLTDHGRRHGALSGADAADADAADAPTSPGLSGNADEIAAGLRAHAEAGAEHFIASLQPCTLETVAAFAEAVSRYRAGSVAAP